MEGVARWALPVFGLGECLRVTTPPRPLAPVFSTAEACGALGRVLAAPGVRVPVPSDGFRPLLVQATAEADATGNLVFVAQVVALCREAGVAALPTADRDFDRFRGFRTVRL
jgi:predicted nucleic acid-binding protein